MNGATPPARGGTGHAGEPEAPGGGAFSGDGEGGAGAGAGGRAGVRELLEAGAVLPPGTEGAGERAVPLTARAYRHPGLDDRVVVRLVAEELGAAEDAAAGSLGLEPAGAPAVVGLGARRSLGFPEWVLVHHPGDGRHALAVVPELERAARQARSTPKAALDAYHRLAAQLAEAVPHFLPTFFEQAGRHFLTADNPAYAAQMFTQARRAEAEHGLRVDEERLDAVFLEFALAGALPVKALSGYARELAARLPAGEALRRFRRLCVRRTAHGLAPSAQMAGDLRRLARAAGKDADAEEQTYLVELLALPATLGAPLGWWKAHRPALIALGRRDPAVRGALLNLMPRNGDDETPAFWLELLEESGAVAGLGDGAVSEEERPADGTSGWLERLLRIWTPGRREEGGFAALYSLVERVAGRLRAELAASGLAVTCKPDVDLLDLLLSLEIPVAGPGGDLRLQLEAWARRDDRRDLLTLAADARFRPAFHGAADRFGDDEEGRLAVRRLAASPGGRRMLTEWMRTVARRSFPPGLPRLPDALGRLTWLPAEALVLAEREVTAVTQADLAAELARTLRGGLIDELGWPAWEEALAALAGPKGLDEIEVADAWPYLIVSGPSQVRVLDAGGTVLVHDLRVPPGDVCGDPGFHYVDGELLVYWSARGAAGALRGYWHTSAGTAWPMEAPAGVWALRADTVTLPLPGGGRATGAGVLRPKDTVVPARARMIGDGSSFWVWDRRDECWREYDPADGAPGRRGVPGFLADALRGAPAGSALRGGWLLPVPTAEATPVGTPVGGLLGWRVIRLPGGSLRGEDLAGRAVTVDGGPDGPGLPVRAVTFPGDDRPRALAEDRGRLRLVDPAGVVVAEFPPGKAPGAFAAGTAMLPPPRYWWCLRPRDPESSLALRRIDGETAAALLKAAVSVESERSGRRVWPGRPWDLPLSWRPVLAAGSPRPFPPPASPGAPAPPPPAPSAREELRAVVRALLPQVRDDALIAGIAGVAWFAAVQQITLDTVAARLAHALAGGREEETSTGLPDRSLARALSGLGLSGPRWYGGAYHGALRQVRAIGQALGAASAGIALHPRAPSPASTGGAVRGAAFGAAPAIRLHFDGPELPHTSLEWASLLDRCAAVAYRAASPAFEPEHARAMCDLLHEIGVLGLASAAESASWRRLSLRLDDADLPDAGGAHVPGTGEAHLPCTGGDGRAGTWRGVLPLTGGAFIAFHDAETEDTGCLFKALFYDPARRFDVPHPYTVRSAGTVGDAREPGWLAEFLARRAELGPVPWRPEAADEFACLTGVTRATARLVVAGLPYVDSHDRAFLPAASRTLLGLKAADAAVARDELRSVDADVRREVVAALLPAGPASLWTDGPDVAAAARVWNARLGRSDAVPEWIATEAARVVRTAWRPGRALSALLDPGAAPELSRDLRWRVRRDRASPVEEGAVGFTESALVGTVTLAAWLSHRLPAGDPVRAALPAALAAVRARLANPDLILDLGRYVNLPGFREIAGPPTEVAGEWERYGAVIMSTYDDRPAPGLRTVLLDEAGNDPYLPALRALAGDAGQPFPVELALRTARDPRFAALLADPGDPAAGERAADGTWWPQDPGRSVPGLVAEAGRKYGLGPDAAALYLMLLAMPDPTDKNVTRWTGWRPARFKAARAELAGAGPVVEAGRTRAGRTLFLPGGWLNLKAPKIPLERWKIPMFDLISGEIAQLGVVVPTEPAGDLYARAWRRVRDGDAPRFEELRVRRGRHR